MRYLSVCSGIEAASVAWHPLGWEPVAFAEIEKIPGAVLKHHYPDVPNWGDMTRFKEWPDAAIDVLVGGTPCQSFSVAGLRKGLADPRGNLCLAFLAIADRYRPQWLLWENVPGVLSSDGGRDFGSFLGGLGQLGYGWSYRVLDAQYVRVDGFSRAVPQRRRRVFVVGHLGDYRRAAAVLFERESLQGHPAPRRQAGKGSAATVAPSLVSSGRGVERTGETCGQDPVIAVPDVAKTLLKQNLQFDPETETYVVGCADVTSTLNDAFGDKQGLEDQHINSGCPLFVTYTTNGQANAAFSNEIALTLTAANEAPYVAHTLRADGFDASEDGSGRGTPLVPVPDRDTSISDSVTCSQQAAVAYSAMPMNSGKDFVVRETDVAQPLMAAGPGLGDQGGDYIAQGITIHGTDKTASVASYTDVAGALRARAPGGQENSSTTAVQTGWAVRRLTPRECERLQGFPDDYTLVPVRGKPAADGPRYKALGNSMAVNVMRWIGTRIQMVSELSAEAAE